MSASSSFSRRTAQPLGGGPGSSEGEPAEPNPPLFLYAFIDRPVRIVWLDAKGHKVAAEQIDFEPQRSDPA